MKIIFPYPNFTPAFGGVETYIKSLTEELISTNPKLEIYIITAQKEYEFIPNKSIKKINIIYAESHKFIHYQLPSKKYFEIIKQISPDIIHLNLPNPFSSFLFLGLAYKNLFQKTKFKLVATYHAHANPSNILIKLCAIAEKYFYYYFISKIFVTSQYYKNEFKFIYPQKNILITTLGVNKNLLKQATKKSSQKEFVKFEKNLFTKYNIPPRSPTVLFVGAMDSNHYYKGIKTLLKAAQTLPKVNFLLIGDGDKKIEYQNTNIALTNSNVYFLGQINNQNLSNFYKICNVLSLASNSSSEGFGIVLIEAMLHKKPVITTTCAGSAQEIKNHHAGIIIKPKSHLQLAGAIEQIINNKSLANKMGANGYKLALTKTWDICAKETLNGYI